MINVSIGLPDLPSVLFTWEWNVLIYFRRINRLSGLVFLCLEVIWSNSRYWVFYSDRWKWSKGKASLLLDIHCVESYNIYVLILEGEKYIMHFCWYRMCIRFFPLINLHTVWSFNVETSNRKFPEKKSFEHIDFQFVCAYFAIFLIVLSSYLKELCRHRFLK